MSIHSTGLGDDEGVIAVSPRRAKEMIGVGTTQLYALLGAGELTSFKIGKCRRITVKSLHAFVARQLAQSERSA